MTPKYAQATVALLGEDGNAMAIVARTVRALQRAGVPKEERNEYTNLALSGDYDNVITTTMMWVSCDTLEEEE